MTTMHPVKERMFGLTDLASQIVTENAEAAGMSRSEYVESLVLRTRFKTSEVKALLKQRRQRGGVGREKKGRK